MKEGRGLPLGMLKKVRKNRTHKSVFSCCMPILIVLKHEFMYFRPHALLLSRRYCERHSSRQWQHTYACHLRASVCQRRHDKFRSWTRTTRHACYSILRFSNFLVILAQTHHPTAASSVAYSRVSRVGFFLIVLAIVHGSNFSKWRPGYATIA